MSPTHTPVPWQHEPRPLLQVGFLSIITEFVGAVALGARVTSTIKNGIISIDRFEGRPGVLMLAMTCAEVGSATWLMVATRLRFPVSTTQTVVGALIGVGFASAASVKWAWTPGSVSQVAASGAIAPLISGVMSAIIFGTIKHGILGPAMLALFIVVEAPTAPSLEEFGAGKAAGIILGVFFGVLLITYVFFMPYFNRRLVKGDARLRFWHIPLGPMLHKDDPWLWFPAKLDGAIVIDYYESAHKQSRSDSNSPVVEPKSGQVFDKKDSDASNNSESLPVDPEENRLPPPAKDKRFMEPSALS